LRRPLGLAPFFYSKVVGAVPIEGSDPGMTFCLVKASSFQKK